MAFVVKCHAIKSKYNLLCCSFLLLQYFDLQTAREAHSVPQQGRKLYSFIILRGDFFVVALCDDAELKSVYKDRKPSTVYFYLFLCT